MFTQTLSFNPLGYPSIFQKPRRLTEVSSWHKHIPFAFALVEMLKPQLFVELGTHKGDSYCTFCQAVDTLQLASNCYAVDTWEGDEQAGKYDNSIYEELKTYHDPLYGAFSTLIRSTFDQALHHFQDASIDLLHIDGLHTYDAVRHDFDSWLPKMSQAGVILFHDINVHEEGFGVWQLWQEIQAHYPTFEFKYGYGLGVAAVGKEIPLAIQSIIASPETIKVVSNLFSRLGEQIAAERDLVEGQKARQLLIEAEQYLAKIDQERLELKVVVKEFNRYRQKLEAELYDLTTYTQQNNLKFQKLEAALAKSRLKQREMEEKHMEMLEASEVQDLKELLERLQSENLTIEALRLQVKELLTYIKSLEQDNLKLHRSLNRYEADLRALQSTRTVKTTQTLSSILASPQRLRRNLLPTGIEGVIDVPSAGATVSGTLTVAGWAYSHKANIEKIEIWLGETKLGTADFGLERPDIVAVRTWQPVAECGYKATFVLGSNISPGQYNLIVIVKDSSNHQQNFTCLIVVTE